MASVMPAIPPPMMATVKGLDIFKFEYKIEYICLSVFLLEILVNWKDYQVCFICTLEYNLRNPSRRS